MRQRTEQAQLALIKTRYSLRIMTIYHDYHPEKIGVQTQFTPRGAQVWFGNRTYKKDNCADERRLETIRSIQQHCAT
jgi:hypothetical protein